MFAGGPNRSPKGGCCTPLAAPITATGTYQRLLVLRLFCRASVRLAQDDLRAITTVAASKDFKKDQLWLNGT